MQKAIRPYESSLKINHHHHYHG
ncbi:BnaA08g27610D [Brassica napus]|uniref:BnaA08g27610D protein n=1 Tax=Brassica napus TaxID=3708 RepID=A0A078FRJ7_BRANA|nr:BnaA08g27610D [Brassica napus]